MRFSLLTTMNSAEGIRENKRKGGQKRTMRGTIQWIMLVSLCSNKAVTSCV